MSNSPQNNEVEHVAFEVVQASALEATERAAIDTQIATAKKYPRSMQLFKKRAIDMATLDEDTAESCIYRRPVGKERDPKTGNMVQKFAEGMSVRMAEIVGASYGNLRVKSFIVEQTERSVRACGQAIDLETNFASSSETVESTVDKNGNPYSERQRILIAKVALSKARRDATFQVVPRALAKPVENEVRRLLLGDSETLTKRREKVISWIGKLGIDPNRVYAALGIAGEQELGAEQLEQLTGIRTAIRDNETTIDESFPKDDSLRKPIFTGQNAAKKVDEKHPDLEPAKQPVPVVMTPAEREAMIDQMKEKMLDNDVSEARLWKYAQDGKHVPEGISALFELPSDILAKLAIAIPSLKGKK